MACSKLVFVCMLLAATSGCLAGKPAATSTTQQPEVTAASGHIKHAAHTYTSTAHKNSKVISSGLHRALRSLAPSSGPANSSSSSSGSSGESSAKSAHATSTTGVPGQQQQQRSSYAELIPEGRDSASIIAILKDKSFLPLLEQVCHGEPASHPSSDGSDAGQPPSGPSLPSGVVSGTPGAVVALDSPGSSSGTNKSSSSFSRKDTPQANPACVGTLKGACRRLYRAALTGFAGVIARHQLQSLVECLGDGLSLVEADGQVFKAERDSYARWWEATKPETPASAPDTSSAAGQQQQQQPSTEEATVSAMDGSMVSSSASFLRGNTDGSSNQGVTSTGDTSDDTGDTILKVDGQAGSSVSDLALERWLLADVGLRSQQVLAQAGSSSMFTVASQAGYDDQNPGISVDLQALSEPAIKASVADNGQQAAITDLAAAMKQPGVKVQSLVPALWNLDRLDQQQLPLDAAYRYGSPTSSGTGQGVTIYTLDSGIVLSHQEFQDWAGNSRASYGIDLVDDDGLQAADCDGHGSHVASSAMGRSVGVAKEARLVAVRVLDCDGEGKISDVIAGLEWITANAKGPSVVTLSLGVAAGTWSRAMEAAVRSTINDHGISLIIAAGNSAEDSCGISPGNVPEAITVAASNLPNKFSTTRQGELETLYRWSNTGACVDIFAPGVDIFGACGGAKRCEAVTNSSYTWASGTSMAVPHVAGMAAIYLEQHPQATPAQVHDALVAAAVSGVLDESQMRAGTPNKLLYSGGMS